MFQFERTSDFFPANKFAAFHTNWIRVLFSLSWISQESFPPELHTEITAFGTKSGSFIFNFSTSFFLNMPIILCGKSKLLPLQYVLSVTWPLFAQISSGFQFSPGQGWPLGNAAYVAGLPLLCQGSKWLIGFKSPLNPVFFSTDLFLTLSTKKKKKHHS